MIKIIFLSLLLVTLGLSTGLENQMYSIQFATFSKANNAQRSYKLLQKILEDVLEDAVLEQKKGKKYTVLVLKNIKNQEQKNKILALSNHYFQNVIVNKQYTKLLKEKSTVPTLQKRTTKVYDLSEVKSMKEEVVIKKEATMKDFLKAVNYYDSGKFILSYSLLKQLNATGTMREKVYFYLGRCAFELKDYENALIHYEKVLELIPVHNRAKLEKARTLFALKKYKESKKLFEEVIQGKPPKAVESNINRYLGAITKATKQHIYSGAFIFGVGYDDNVKNGNSVDFLNLNGTILQLQSTINPPKSSLYAQGIVAFNHKYIFEKNRAISWETTPLVYSQSYDTGMGSSNILLLGLTSGPAYVQKKYKLSFPLSYQKIFVGTNAYVNQYDMKPQVLFSYTDSLLFSTSLKIQKKNYVVDTLRDATYMEVGIGVKKIIDKKDLLSLNVLYGTDKKDGGLYRDVNKNTTMIAASYLKNLVNDYSFLLSYTYLNYDYADKDALSGLDRKDKNSILSVKLSKKITDKITVNLEYANTKNNSTVSLFSYKKQTYLSNMSIAF
ncbi:tetratricopeptide repeat protein [Sulfurimonas sp. SAG-AH-194-I05]|nr:tetratricopeptide repeat protein [Sulfurimonas sp. SAG-AH-194-I05]MDF1874281.1 tetratricopeptide repeat protein [Sulfurimonas sp. SAG-AH-194-I05]